MAVAAATTDTYASAPITPADKTEDLVGTTSDCRFMLPHHAFTHQLHNIRSTDNLNPRFYFRRYRNKSSTCRLTVAATERAPDITNAVFWPSMKARSAALSTITMKAIQNQRMEEFCAA